MDPTNTQEVMAAARQWWDDLPPKIIEELAVARVLLNSTHGAKQDKPYEEYLKDIISGVGSYENDPESTFPLIAAMAVRAMEQVQRTRQPQPERCGCPACALRRIIEARFGDRMDPAVMAAARDFIQARVPEGQDEIRTEMQVIQVDSPEQLAEVFERIFNPPKQR